MKEKYCTVIITIENIEHVVNVSQLNSISRYEHVVNNREGNRVR